MQSIQFFHLNILRLCKQYFQSIVFVKYTKYPFSKLFSENQNWTFINVLFQKSRSTFSQGFREPTIILSLKTIKIKPLIDMLLHYQ